MTKKTVLFAALLILFVVTAIITLLGVLGVIDVPDFYLKGLFGAFIVELAAAVFTLAVKGNILEEDSKKKKGKPQAANLRLHMWGDHRAPDMISEVNIFRWYYLQNYLSGVTTEGEEFTHNPSNTLFVSFNEDVVISTLKVVSPDSAIPRYEVKEFNQRFAIISFGGTVGPGTLELEVRP